MKKLALCVCVCVCVLFPVHFAFARVRVLATEVESYNIPAGFDAHTARVVSTLPGVTLLHGTVGIKQAATCTILSIDADGAMAYAYRNGDAPTQCLGVVPDAQGGFMLRGVNPMALPDEISGVTTRVARDGSIVWSVKDQTVGDALPTASGGSGAFTGIYAEPLPVLAYSEALGRLIAFSSATLTIGAQERVLSQAHVVSVETGRVQVSGLTFGAQGFERVLGTVARASDHPFVLYFAGSEDRGTRFYTYNGRRSINSFELGQRSWDDRQVVQLRVQDKTPHHLMVLWVSQDESLEQSAQVGLFDSNGRPFWTQSFMAQEGMVFLGRPLDVFMGKEHAVITHRALDGGLFARVLLMHDGTSLGIAALDEVTAHEAISVHHGPDGSLQLIALDEDAVRLRQYTLEFQKLSGDTVLDMGVLPDAGGDMLTPIPKIDPVGEACGCVQIVPRAALVHPLWVFILFFMGWSFCSSKKSLASESGDDGGCI